MTQAQTQEVLSSVRTEWYLLQNGRRQGPYSYYDILKKLQNKELYGSELIQADGQNSWVPLSCMEDFSEDKIRKLIESGDAELQKILVKRKNPRVQKILPLFVHDDLVVWKGKTFSVSTQGAGIILENPFFEPKDILKVHFCCSSDGSKSFNTKVEVLSKKVSDKFISQRTSVKYSVLFKDLDEHAEKVVREWVSKK